jgi:hypothetical protein
MLDIFFIKYKNEKYELAWYTDFFLLNQNFLLLTKSLNNKSDFLSFQG